MYNAAQKLSSIQFMNAASTMALVAQKNAIIEAISPLKGMSKVFSDMVEDQQSILAGFTSNLTESFADTVSIIQSQQETLAETLRNSISFNLVDPIQNSIDFSVLETVKNSIAEQMKTLVSLVRWWSGMKQLICWNK